MVLNAFRNSSACESLGGTSVAKKRPSSSSGKTVPPRSTSSSSRSSMSRHAPFRSSSASSACSISSSSSGSISHGGVGTKEEKMLLKMVQSLSVQARADLAIQASRHIPNLAVKHDLLK